MKTVSDQPVFPHPHTFGSYWAACEVSFLAHVDGSDIYRHLNSDREGTRVLRVTGGPGHGDPIGQDSAENYVRHGADMGLITPGALEFLKHWLSVVA